MRQVEDDGAQHRDVDVLLLLSQALPSVIQPNCCPRCLVVPLPSCSVPDPLVAGCIAVPSEMQVAEAGCAGGVWQLNEMVNGS